MYLIKTAYYDAVSRKVAIQDGIWALKKRGELQVIDSYWGKTEVSGKDSRLEEKNNQVLISYTQGYDVFMNEKNYMKLNIYLEETCTSKSIHGYIIFIKADLGLKMKTNGTLCFVKKPDEAVVILEEGRYIEFASNRIEVSNQKLEFKSIK